MSLFVFEKSNASFFVVIVVVVVHSFFLSLCDRVLTDQFRTKYTFLIHPMAFNSRIERVFGVDGFQEPTLDSKILIIAMLFVQISSIH